MTTILFAVCALLGFLGLFGSALGIPDKTQGLLVVACLVGLVITLQTT